MEPPSAKDLREKVLSAALSQHASLLERRRNASLRSAQPLINESLRPVTAPTMDASATTGNTSHASRSLLTTPLSALPPIGEEVNQRNAAAMGHESFRQFESRSRRDFVQFRQQHLNTAAIVKRTSAAASEQAIERKVEHIEQERLLQVRLGASLDTTLSSSKKSLTSTMNLSYGDCTNASLRETLLSQQTGALTLWDGGEASTISSSGGGSSQVLSIVRNVLRELAQSKSSLEAFSPTSSSSRSLVVMGSPSHGGNVKSPPPPLRVADFSCLAFDEEEFQVFVTIMSSYDGVDCLNLQSVAVPFGREHRLLQIIQKNPTPIVRVELLSSSFNAYPDLVRDVQQLCSKNEAKRAERDSDRAMKRSKRLHRQQREDLMRRVQELDARRKHSTQQLIDDESREFKKILEAWTIIFSFVRQKEFSGSIIERRRAEVRKLVAQESLIRRSIVQHGQQSLIQSFVNAHWQESREVLVAEEFDARREVWRLYCSNWQISTVTTRRIAACHIVAAKDLERECYSLRTATIEDEMNGRVSIHELYVLAAQNHAKHQMEIRSRKDDDYRKLRQRRAEEEYALEQQRAKARMESLMHGGGGDDPVGAKSSKQKEKTYHLGDEDILRRQMEEWNTQIFEALGTIRKITERCVEKEAKLREAVLKYQRALGMSPRLVSRVSVDAPPSMIAVGQDDALHVEPTMSIQLHMDSFWVVRCEILRDEIQKLTQPLKQTRKECAQQLAPLLQDVDRWYRYAGLQQQLVWPQNLRSLYTTPASKDTPNKELFEHIDWLLAQSVRRIKFDKETIFCGDLTISMPEAFQKYGALALDERALAEFRQQKPRHYNTSKPVFTWECIYEGVRAEIEVPQCMRLDPESLVQCATKDSTVGAARQEVDDHHREGQSTGRKSKKTSRATSTNASNATTPRPSVAGESGTKVTPPLTAREGSVASAEAATVVTAPASLQPRTPVVAVGGEEDPTDFPIRCKYAANKLRFTIPTGVTPEQIEAVVKACRFVPTRDFGAILLEPLIGCIDAELVVFTKSIRQRLLPLTNIALNGHKSPAPIAGAQGAPGAPGKGSPTRKSITGLTASPTSKLPPALMPVPSHGVDASNDIPPVKIKKANPLRALTIQRSTLNVTLNFLMAKRMLTLKSFVEHTHDAREGALSLLHHGESFTLCEPPTVARVRRSPFQVVFVDNPIRAVNNLSVAEGDLPLMLITDNSVSADPLSPSQGRLNSIHAPLPSDSQGSFPLAASSGTMTAPATTTTTTTTSAPVVYVGHRSGNAVFQNLVITVQLHQSAQNTTEDILSVESRNHILAKQGQMYLVEDLSPVEAELIEEAAAAAQAGDANALSIKSDDGPPIDPFTNITPLGGPHHAGGGGKQSDLDDCGSHRTSTNSQRHDEHHSACLGTQFASFEVTPHQLTVSFLNVNCINANLVQEAIEAIVYRNGSVDPTTGTRKISIHVEFDDQLGFRDKIDVNVNVTATDEPTDWEVHVAKRVMYFPIEASHGQQWVERLGETQVEQLLPPSVLKFSDSVEVLDDDTTFFSSGHLRFKLFDDSTAASDGGGASNNALPFSSDESAKFEYSFWEGPLMSLPLEGSDKSSANFDCSQRVQPKPLSCDEGVGIFLDIPNYKTKFGLCMVERASGSTDPSAHKLYVSEGIPTGGAIFDLFDDGYLQGSVHYGARVLGHVERKMTVLPSSLTDTVVAMRSPHVAEIVLPEEVALRDPHRKQVMIHTLTNEIHIEFAQSGNGATVDTVQELLKLASFTNLKRFPKVDSDVKKRYVTVNMLVGATTGRRDILGQLLADSNVNTPLHAVIEIESRPSFLKAPSSFQLNRDNAENNVCPRSYPENSGQLFLFDEAIGLPHSFTGGFLRVEVMDPHHDPTDRIDCVDRQEAILFHEREEREHKERMGAGHNKDLYLQQQQQVLLGAGGQETSRHGSVAPPSFNVPDAPGGTEAGLAIEIPSSGSVSQGLNGERMSAAASVLTSALSRSKLGSMMKQPSSFANHKPTTRYGSVRLVQNPIATTFSSPSIPAAVVKPSHRSLAAYSMKEFAKVNMLSSTAESVAAKAAGGESSTDSSYVRDTPEVQVSPSDHEVSFASELSASRAKRIKTSTRSRFSFLPTSKSFASKLDSDDEEEDSFHQDGNHRHYSGFASFESRGSSQQLSVLPTPKPLGSGVMQFGDLNASVDYGSFKYQQPNRKSVISFTANGGLTAGNDHDDKLAVMTREEELMARQQSRTIAPHEAVPLMIDTAELEQSPVKASRSRSVVFHGSTQDITREEPSVVRDREDLMRSQVNPIMQSMLLAASSRRRSSLFHLHTLKHDSVHGGPQHPAAGTRSNSVVMLEGDSLASSQAPAAAMMRGSVSVVVHRLEDDGKGSPTKQRRISTVGRSAQELVWANRLKKILCERADSFLFLLNKSCAKLISDRLEHLEFLGVDPWFVDDDDAVVASTGIKQRGSMVMGAGRSADTLSLNSSPRQSLGAEASGDTQFLPEPAVTVHNLHVKHSEVATSVCHRRSAAVVILFEPSTVITPAIFAAITRSVSFESRSRSTVRIDRVVRVTLRMYEEGACSLLLPIKVLPYDDPMEITCHRPFLHWRHGCTEITPTPKQLVSNPKGGAVGAAGGKAKAAPAPAKKMLGAIAATNAMLTLQNLALKDGLGVLRLFPREYTTLHDADTLFWDGGSIEVTIQSGGTVGDCLVMLTVEQQKLLRKIGEAGKRGSGLSARGGVTPHSGRPSDASVLTPQATDLGDSAAPQRVEKARDDLDDYLLVCEPPFPCISNQHIDPSNHAAVDADRNVYLDVFQKERTLHVVRMSDGSMVQRNVGKCWVDRAAFGAAADTKELDLDSSIPHRQSPYSPNAPPLPTQAVAGSVVTLLRVELTPTPRDNPYDEHITIDLVRLIVFNIGYFNVIPPDVDRVTKNVVLAVRDRHSPENPGLQTVTLETLPSFFHKPLQFSEPIYYPSRTAMEGRYEFIFQHLRPPCQFADKDRAPLCVIEVFGASGWLPRDTLMFRFAGSTYVLTQDGQVICGKELVLRHAVISSSNIRMEVTKECRGATWGKIAGALSLISYHFDIKDLGKDAAAPLQPSTNPAPGAPPVATGSPVPGHDRIVALQVTETGVKDLENRPEVWTLLQRISSVAGLTSEQ